MKKHIQHIFLIAASLLCVASCNKTNTSDIDEGQMSFAMKPGSPFLNVEHHQTKATAATGVTSFKCEATQGAAGSETSGELCWNNIVFTSDGEATPTYTTSPKKYWPVEDPEFNFYAVSATSGDEEAVASAAPDLTFAADGTYITMTAAYDKDVVCAYESAADNIYKAKNGLGFEHIYARVSTVNVTAVAPSAISNITITLTDPKTGGVYNLRTGHGQIDGTGWSDLVPGSGTQQLYRNEGSIASGENHTGADNDFYIVPGTYELKATWTASIDDYTQTYVNMTSTTTLFFQGGKINSVLCSLSGDPVEVVFGIIINEWGSNSITGVEFDRS